MCLYFCLAISYVYVNDGRAKAENGKGSGAAFSTRSVSCQGETLKDTLDILTVWTATQGLVKRLGRHGRYVFSLLVFLLYDD